jgi:predicted nucleic acid-binding protein
VGAGAATRRRPAFGLTFVARLLLDTTVLIDALRGRPAAERLRSARRRGDEPWVCAVSVEELWRGVHAREQVALRRLLRGLRCAPLGASEGERAGTWRRAFAARGTTLHQADCLIAAAAVGVGSTLVTGNPEDFPMTELDVRHWPVGE